MRNCESGRGGDELSNNYRTTLFGARAAREYAPITAELEDVDTVIGTLSVRFQKLHTKLIKGRYWFHGRLLRHLATVCELLRENYDRWHLLDAEKKAIERAANASAGAEGSIPARRDRVQTNERGVA